MIEHPQGNLLEADAEALVNTVNCVGVMGKGIALQFKQAFPENFRVYERTCRAGEVQPGRMLVVETGRMIAPRYIINFPTKRHWREGSRLEDIDAGLTALIEEVQRLGIQSIAVPPLGCGNGGLDWSVVRPRIEAAFARVPGVRVLLFSPLGAPDPAAMPVGTKRPDMTPARALFVKLLEQYAALEYTCTLLEVQKLAYFLQEAGEPLRLEYKAAHYGPYAANLNKVLERIEGHFIRGYGDSQSPTAVIHLERGAAEEADRFLAGHPDSRRRLESISQLITGFETPYGMELLASVHWLACHGRKPVTGAAESLAALHAWSPRKRKLFKPRHIEVAWQRLVETGWIAAGQGSAPSVDS
jgi:O-acetyl-ADP-ribose deacetylase (regulator of RNase III)